MIAGHQQLVSPGTVWWAATVLISVFSLSTMMFACVSFGWRKKNRYVQEDDQPFPRLRKRADLGGQSDLEVGQLRPQVSAKMGAFDPMRRGNRLLEGGRASPALPRGTYLLKDSGGGGDRNKPHVIASRTAAAIDGLKRISKLELSYDDVIIATNNFDPKRLIGRGGFGSVYKGVLAGGRVVAVKRMDRGNHHLHSIRQMGGADRLLPDQLLSELEVLARVQSQHLVNLVGYAIGVGLGAGEDAASAVAAAAGGRRSELVLVYDYMPNGSLYGHLHGKHAGNNSLNWTTRLKIALDVAEGINYLHHICKPPIIHRDIKAGNVLLNKEFVACVADFGLSKLLGHTEIGPDGQAHVTDMSNDVKGTFGYVDPTYILTRQIAPKSDVYSYGILLLELLTGRKPLDQLTLPISDDEEEGPGRRVDARVGLAEWAVSRIAKERVEEIMDAKLGGKYVKEVAQRVGELAVSCVNPDRDLRPAMARVVAILSQVINSMSANNPRNNDGTGAAREGVEAAVAAAPAGAAADGPPLAIMPPPPPAAVAPPPPRVAAGPAKAHPPPVTSPPTTKSTAAAAAATAAELAETRAAPAGAADGSDEDPSAVRIPTRKVAVLVQSSDNGQQGPNAGGRDLRTSLTPVAVGVADTVHPIHARKVKAAVPNGTAVGGGGAATSAGASLAADVAAMEESPSSSVPAAAAVAVKQPNDQGGELGGAGGREGGGGGDGIRRRDLDKTTSPDSKIVSHQRRTEDGGVGDRHELEDPSTTRRAAEAGGAGVTGGEKSRREGNSANRIEDHQVLAGSSSSSSTTFTISSFSNDEETSHTAGTATSASRPREAAARGLAGVDSSGSSDGESYSGSYGNGNREERGSRDKESEGGGGVGGGGGGYPRSSIKEGGGKSSTPKTHKQVHPEEEIDTKHKSTKGSNPVGNPVSVQGQVNAGQLQLQQGGGKVGNGEVQGSKVVGETLGDVGGSFVKTEILNRDMEQTRMSDVARC